MIQTFRRLVDLSCKSELHSKPSGMTPRQQTMLKLESENQCSSLKMALSMKVNGTCKEEKMVKVFKFGLMDRCTRATGKTIKQTEKDA